MAIPTTLSGAEMTRGHRHARGVDQSTPRRAPARSSSATRRSRPRSPSPSWPRARCNALGHAFEGPCTPRAHPVATLAAHDAARRLVGRASRGAEPDRDELALGALLAGYTIDSAGFGLHHVMAQTLVSPGSRPRPGQRRPAPAHASARSRGASRSSTRRWRRRSARTRRRPPRGSARAPAPRASASWGSTRPSSTAPPTPRPSAPELDSTPPRADRAELRALYEPRSSPWRPPPVPRRWRPRRPSSSPSPRARSGGCAARARRRRPRGGSGGSPSASTASRTSSSAPSSWCVLRDGRVGAAVDDRPDRGGLGARGGGRRGPRRLDREPRDARALPDPAPGPRARRLGSRRARARSRRRRRGARRRDGRRARGRVARGAGAGRDPLDARRHARTSSAASSLAEAARPRAPAGGAATGPRGARPGGAGRGRARAASTRARRRRRSRASSPSSSGRWRWPRCWSCSRRAHRRRTG